MTVTERALLVAIAETLERVGGSDHRLREAMDRLQKEDQHTDNFLEAESLRVLLGEK
jgi:hypothetical protein